MDSNAEILMPLSDANDLDAVVHELGIEDSDTTPAEAVRELKAEIERLRASEAELRSEVARLERVLSVMQEDAGKLFRRCEAAEAALADLLSNPCLAKRKPGEPIFVLLGRDPEAPDAIRAWAERRAARERVASWRKVNAARAVATEMQNYRRALTKETSDDRD